LRETGKTVERAENFFLEETQTLLQQTLVDSLRADLQPKGLIIDRILIRSITLPPFIMKAIEAKKEREQEVEKQKAELERYRTEQQQKIAQAEAEREAAEQQAQKVRVLAEAQAYEIQKINEAIAQNPAYLQLQAMDALKEISKSASSKIYFINGDSPQPLPLMNIGDVLAPQR
jgi:regulator of protease activity HflC (stomatin/prohibitin superfamily)